MAINYERPSYLFNIPLPFKKFSLRRLKPLTDIGKYRILLSAVALLLLPALLTNLGLVAFYGDEGIRALVALEMKISGNFVAPTLFGQPYYNKPPLYNWILLAFYELTGRNDEFATRLPTVAFLLCYAAMVAVAVKKQLGTAAGRGGPMVWLMPALALVTCGRMLFWDSMLALIDVSFSWVMYALFLAVYRVGEAGRPGRLFAWAYALAAVGFLLKGLPSLVFLAIALLSYLVWQKKGRWLLSWAHLGGMAVLVGIVGSYYALYAQQHGLSQVLKTLFDESAKRTFVAHGTAKTLLHLLSFPFEMWYHFLPWTLLAVYLFRKNAGRLLRQNKFVAWNLLVLATTILPYWTSVEVYPRYLFMHVPLLFTALFYLHAENLQENARLARWVEMAFFVLCCLACAAGFALLFWPPAQGAPYLYLKTIFIIASLGGLACCYWRWAAQRMLAFALALLVARLAFDWFVLPARLDVECSTKARETTLEAVKKLEGRPLAIFRTSLGWQPVTGYYYTRETGQILKEEHEHFDPDRFYLVNTELFDRQPVADELAKITIVWHCGELTIGKIPE